MSKVIMAWSKCKVEIGATPDAETMATTLTSVGNVKNQSCTLESSEGDSLEAVATGGETIAKESNEGNFTFTCRVIEPEDELLTLLGVGAADSTEGANAYNVNSHLVSIPFSLKVTPKNKGARGIAAPKTDVTFGFGWSEEEGNYCDLTFEIVHGLAGYWYQRFTTTAAL